MFVKIINGIVEKFPYSLSEFRKSFPNSSFPKEIPTSLLEEHGIYAVKQTNKPELDRKTHFYSHTVEQVEGVWTQVWSTVEFDEDIASENIRKYRNKLLVGSDWTQISDSPVNQEAWATYRQTLRDIPAQDGFPYNVTWPQEP